MKCHKPNSDQEASMEVFVDGYRCPEYTLPSTSNSDQNTLECFIPVSDGERITLKGTFNGTVLHGAIDVLADGSFLIDKRIEGKAGDLKSINRNFDIQKVYHVPKSQTEVVEGDLHVIPLKYASIGTSHEERGVGSLAIVISVNENTEEQYEIVPAYLDMTCGGWRERGESSDAGIKPTHELSVRITDSDIHKNRQSKHRRHAKQLRFGSKPWATLVFYYRSISAIEAAGCEPRLDQSHALQAKTNEEHVVDSIEDIFGNTKAEKLSPGPVPKKQKLFGQHLLPKKNAQSQDATHQPDVPVQVAALPTPTALAGSNQQETVAAVSFSSPPKRRRSLPGTSRGCSPNKKPRMSNKKAALLAQIDEKRQRNDAAKKEAEEAKKLREDEQRKLEAKEAEELEELEKMNAAMDDELEEWTQAKAEEVAKIEELKEALNEE